MDRCRLAVSLTRCDPPLAEQVRAACAAGADLIELRVDLLRDEAAVAALLRQPRAVPFILTIRAASEGGGWAGASAERWALCERLALLRPGYVDIEYSAWAGSADVRRMAERICGGAPGAGTRNRLILSYHDLQETPADLSARIEPMLAAGADVAKVVFLARDATDAWRVLELLRGPEATGRVAALAMGEAGILTRALAPRFGGYLAFVAPERGAESAPGQPTIAELTGVYRWRDVTPATGVYGVAGWPVGHSRSPLWHNRAMRAAGVDGVFVPMPVAPTYADFAVFMDHLDGRPELDVRGLSVTLPHKEHALRWLEAKGFSVTGVARRVGAVNTLVRNGASWLGENTDVAGAVDALRAAAAAAAFSFTGCTAAVLGAGGAARAAVVALQTLGCTVTVYNRTAGRAARLAQELQCAWLPWERRVRKGTAVVVNCTSVGMEPEPAASPLPGAGLGAGMLVMDTVYAPPETRLLREARASGCQVASGLSMFIGQAARQFALWHGRPAPPDVMRGALEA